MSPSDSFSSSRPLLEALAAAAGLPDLPLDAAGGCTLLFDGHPVHFQDDPARHALTFFATLGPVPQGRRSEVLGSMLKANRFWRGTGGATLSLDEAEPAEALLAMRFDTRSPAAAPEFIAAVERFIDQAEDWRAWLIEGGSEPPGDGHTLPPSFFQQMA